MSPFEYLENTAIIYFLLESWGRTVEFHDIDLKLVDTKYAVSFLQTYSFRLQQNLFRWSVRSYHLSEYS
jgi:hypothetical protein